LLFSSIENTTIIAFHAYHQAGMKVSKKNGARMSFYQKYSRHNSKLKTICRVADGFFDL